MKKIYLFIFTIIISSCSTTGGQERYEEMMKDLSRYIEIDIDKFYGVIKLKLKVINQSAPVEFDDPQEKIEWGAWKGGAEGCKFGGGFWGTTFKLEYRLTGKDKGSVRMLTMLPSLTPRYGDVYSIKIGNNAPIDIDSNGGWKKENPENVLFGTEQPRYVSSSSFQKKHIKILEQFSKQEKLGLNNVIYSMRREGTNSSGNKRYETSDCRLANNGRFTHMLNSYNSFYN